LFWVVTTSEGSETVANDIVQEGLIMLIALIHFWERATSLVTDIVFHKFEEPGTTVTEFGIPVRVHLSMLTIKQVDRRK
jgi:hypothetical protein